MLIKLIRKIIYNPFCNLLLRNSLKLFKRILPQKYQIPVSGVIKVNVENKQFYLKTNQTDYVCRMLFWGGVDNYEPSVTRIFIPLVKKINTFFDVGASIGFYSFLSSALNKDIQIYAFEPGRGAYEYLEYNILKNSFKNIKPFKLAASNINGETTFFIESNTKATTEQLSGGSSLKKGEEEKFDYREEKVSVVTLDKFVQENSLKSNIDLMKLDTERTENLVLDGASEILKTHKPIIICEVIKNNIEVKLENILRQHGYLMYKTTLSGLQKVSTLQSQDELVYYLFVQPDKEFLINEYISL